MGLRVPSQTGNCAHRRSTDRVVALTHAVVRTEMRVGLARSLGFPGQRRGRLAPWQVLSRRLQEVHLSGPRRPANPYRLSASITPSWYPCLEHPVRKKINTRWRKRYTRTNEIKYPPVGRRISTGRWDVQLPLKLKLLCPSFSSRYWGTQRGAALGGERTPFHKLLCVAAQRPVIFSMCSG